MSKENHKPQPADQPRCKSLVISDSEVAHLRSYPLLGLGLGVYGSESDEREGLFGKDEGDCKRDTASALSEDISVFDIEGRA